MPTENQSSNTEMAAEQLPPCATDVYKSGICACLVGDVPKHAVETICQSLSAVTGWKIDWHYIGGRTHIKALAPATQPHPEPIAWMVGTAIWWTKEEAERDAATTGLPEVAIGPMPTREDEPAWFMTEGGVSAMHAKAKAMSDQQGLDTSSYCVPLYTHADPGEVERLRSVIEQQKNLIASLRAELVESRSIDASAEPSAAAESIPDGYCLMPRRLTAENGAKALLLGEFKLEVTRECPECIELDEPTEGCEICDGEGEYAQRHTIPWDQIKFIYSEAVKGLALQPSVTCKPS